MTVRPALSPTENLRNLYDIGDPPPLGHVPAEMHAWLIRPKRFGKPLEAFRKEVVATPTIGDDEALVYVMAAGVNYNNVWAGLGIPVNVIAARNKAGEPEPFHIGGQRRVRHRLQGRQGRRQRQGRRRGRGALRSTTAADCPWVQSRRRSDVFADLPDLGLRDQLRQLRPVHPGPGAAMHAEAQAHDLGGIGRLHPGRRPPPGACCTAGAPTRPRVATSC